MPWSDWKKFGSLENITFVHATCGDYKSGPQATEFPILDEIVIPEKCTEILILCCFAENTGYQSKYQLINYTTSGAITQSEIIYQPIAGNLADSIIKCKVTSNETVSFTLISAQLAEMAYLYAIPIGILFLN